MALGALISAIDTRLRAETRVAAAEFGVVRRLRIAVKALIAAFILLDGMAAQALQIGMLYFCYEVAGMKLAERIRAKGNAAPGVERVFFALLVVATNLLMVYPVTLVTGHGSLPLFVIAGVWLLGLTVFISNNFNKMPIINTISLGGLGAIAMSVLHDVLWPGHLKPGALLEQAFAYVILALYIGYCFFLLERQNRVNAALERARRNAANRLAEIEYLARHDDLTGLLNRHTFDRSLAQWFADASADAVFWVLIIDLNDFKPLNDTLGHEAGDAVLAGVARRLQDFTTPDGLCGRIGGDEFAIAVRPAPGADAHTYMFRLNQALSKPLEWNRRVLDVSASIGLAVSDSAPRSVQVACSQADRAMFRAKRARRDAGVMFTPLMSDLASAQEDRACLTHAIENDEITPFFQPKVCLQTGRILGFEALARWQHPSGGLVPPQRFLPWVQNAGLDDMMGVHIANRVCARMREWDAAGVPPLDVSFNVSEGVLVTHNGRAALEAAVGSVQPLLEKGWQLTVEITEDVFFARKGAMLKDTVQLLREAGARVALDDFGTGYASLRHLQELHFDEIKIDRSFTAGIGESARAEALIRFTLEIARALGLSVVVEGVETEAQRFKLLGYRATVGQGFLWSRAVPADEALAMLLDESPRLVAAPG